MFFFKKVVDVSMFYIFVLLDIKRFSAGNICFVIVLKLNTRINTVIVQL